MKDHDLKDLVFQTAKELAGKGLGWAQEAVVLREVADRLRGRAALNLRLEQAVLSAWHDLFRERKLSWGYDLDNPNSPFFHVPVDMTRDEAAATPAL